MKTFPCRLITELKTLTTAKNKGKTTNLELDLHALQLVNIAILAGMGVFKLQMDSLTLGTSTNKTETTHFVLGEEVDYLE